MPSPPSPSADHFAAVEGEVRQDSRLSQSQKRLLVRSIRAARRDHRSAPDTIKLLGACFLRAYWQLLAAPPGAITTIRAIDALTRLGGRIGFLRPGALRKPGMRPPSTPREV